MDVFNCPKTEPFKQRLAKVGYKQMQESRNKVFEFQNLAAFP